MKTYIIGCGPGDPQLLTLKAYKLIQEADVIIYAGSLINKEILGFTKKGAQMHDSAKLNLEEIGEIFKDAKGKNLNVARLHSGDPSIYGAINEQIALLNELGIDFEIVPGISSFLAAAAALKTELTMPEVSQSIIITRLTGRTPVPKSQSLSSFAQHKATICIFLSIQKIEEVVNELLEGYSAKTKAAVVYKATQKDELIIKGNLSNIAAKVKEANITKTALIIVADSLNNIDFVSKLYDKNFSHEYRTAEV